MPGKKAPMVLGIDPGGSQTGLCLIKHDGSPVTACIVERKKVDSDAEYIREAIRVAQEHLDSSAGALLAVEGLRSPRGFYKGKVSIINVTGLMGAAMVLGAVLNTWPEAIIVPPGGNGSSPLETYPASLVGPREKSGGGWMRHCRSAFDVAKAAQTFHLTGEFA